MRRIVVICCLLLLSLAIGHRTLAQETTPEQNAATVPDTPLHYFHLLFVVQELGADSKPVNSRTYSTTVSTGPHNSASIRTGSRIPIATGTSSTGESKVFVNTQFQYIDVGVNFDVREIREIDHQLSLDLTSEVSSVADSSDPNLHEPVIRQNKWHSVVFIPIGKPTVVFTSDSLDSKGSMRVTVTATPLP